MVQTQAMVGLQQKVHVLQTQLQQKQFRARDWPELGNVSTPLVQPQQGKAAMQLLRSPPGLGKGASRTNPRAEEAGASSSSSGDHARPLWPLAVARAAAAEVEQRIYLQTQEEQDEEEQAEGGQSVPFFKEEEVEW